MQLAFCTDAVIRAWFKLFMSDETSYSLSVKEADREKKSDAGERSETPTQRRMKTKGEANVRGRRRVRNVKSEGKKHTQKKIDGSAARGEGH